MMIMKKTAYFKPLVEVTQIESEQFLAGSDAIGTNLEDLGIDNTPTDEDGRVREIFFFEKSDFLR